MSTLPRHRGGGNSLGKISLVSVYEGRLCCGFILARGKTGFEAFDPNDKSLGIFETQRQAAHALLVKEGV
jgi:hypothetical protein